MQIPFAKPTLGEEEKRAIAEVIDSGWVVMGKKTAEFEEKFAGYVGSKFAVFVDSDTSALFLALKYLNPRPGQKVAVPSLTFVATPEVIVNAGATPVFMDVDKKDFCANSKFVPAGVKFALPVHLTGNRAPLEAPVYDSAHRVERDEVKDSRALWCYSFYATKNLNTVNGGMIATNDEKACRWLKLARDHGMTKGTTERYKDGQQKFEVEFVGFREKSDDLHAAIGLVQLAKLDHITRERNRVVKTYNRLLDLNRVGNHLYPVLVNNRPKFIEFMKARGVQCMVHFISLHKTKAYAPYAPGLKLPNTEYLAERMVSLPLYPQMTEKETRYVVDNIKASNLFIHE